MFINKQKHYENKDDVESNLAKTLDLYLERTVNFKSSFTDFAVVKSKGFNIIDESQSCEVGYKARAGEFLIQNLVNLGIKEIVYVQPRRGFAGISLSWLAKKYGLKLTLVMPSSKQASQHQLLCIELGAHPIFVRIAAMPNANRLAKIYANSTGAYFIPLGLHHEDVIAAGVKSVYDFFNGKDKPSTIWTVISTGVLTRSLQIALPDTSFKAIAVSRNIQQGELGRAEFISYHKPFEAVSDKIPDEFNCENSYDAKGWDVMSRLGQKEDWFFNVAGNAESPMLDAMCVDSYRDWGDMKDFKKLNINIK